MSGVSVSTTIFIKDPTAIMVHDGSPRSADGPFLTFGVDARVLVSASGTDHACAAVWKAVAEHAADLASRYAERAETAGGS